VLQRVAAAGTPRWTLALLAAGVAAAHLWLADRHWPARLGDGQAALQRIEVAFVRELAPAAPPVAAAAPVPAPRIARLSGLPAALPASAAASEPQREATLEPTPPPLPEPPALGAPEALPPLASVAPLPAALAASSSAEAGFDWPPSTRLTYKLSGNYQGPVEGQATVEWLRQGSRYQVWMEVSVGPAFAPLLSRRVTSEGLITPEGLQPRRYDEETRALLGSPRRLTIWLDEDRVRLPGGTQVPRPPGLQDSASQFVQMTWLFITAPQRLAPGSSLEVPLALPRRVEPWVYEVVGTEIVDSPAGPVEAVHVRPRRPTRPGGDLVPEMWVAPSLQYLPVRMVIRRDEQTWIDLLIERLPQQAAPVATTTATPAPPPATAPR
jgi:Protein of unknown function (DUF3108)